MKIVRLISALVFVLFTNISSKRLKERLSRTKKSVKSNDWTPGNKNLGDACTEQTGFSQCRDKFYCFRGTCQGSLAENQDCENQVSGSMCSRGMFCHTNNKCTKLLQLRERCEHKTIGSYCLPPYQCQQGKCRIPDYYGCQDKHECYKSTGDTGKRKCDNYPFGDNLYVIRGYMKACRHDPIQRGGLGDGETKSNFVQDPRRCDQAFFSRYSDLQQTGFKIDSFGTDDLYNNDIKASIDAPCPGLYN